VFSVALMGLAATFVARLLTRHRWIAWLGLALILYVALKMINDGYLDIRGVGPHSRPEPAAATAPLVPPAAGAATLAPSVPAGPSAAPAAPAGASGG